MRLSGRRPGLFATLAAALLLLTSPGSANTRLDPEQPAVGPAAAKGAVVWSHGRSIHSEDSESPTPYYMTTLREGGWDTFRFNRMREGDTLQESSRQLVRYVHQLRERGYKKVALAGQSFGAFLSLMAADASEEVYAVVATAPAAYGSFNEFYDSWRSNATNLYPLLEQVKRARVMLFYFHGDEFDPGGRGDRSREILSKKRLEHLVVDQPRTLTGHWAASTGLFVRRYGSCILDFIDRERIGGEMDCEQSWGVRPSKSIPLPANFQPARTGRSVGPQSAFAGKWYGFYTNGREILLAIEKVNRDEVTAVYALGPGIEPDQQAEWVRRSGRISDDEMVFRERGRNTLRYRLRPDGSLSATWISVDGTASLEATLRRID
jgi:dienelactone hydrolase